MSRPFSEDVQFTKKVFQSSTKNHQPCPPAHKIQQPHNTPSKESQGVVQAPQEGDGLCSRSPRRRWCCERSANQGPRGRKPGKSAVGAAVVGAWVCRDPSPLLRRRQHYPKTGAVRRSGARGRRRRQVDARLKSPMAPPIPPQKHTSLYYPIFFVLSSLFFCCLEVVCVLVSAPGKNLRGDPGRVQPNYSTMSAPNSFIPVRSGILEKRSPLSWPWLGEVGGPHGVPRKISQPPGSAGGSAVRGSSQLGQEDGRASLTGHLRLPMHPATLCTNLRWLKTLDAP